MKKLIPLLVLYLVCSSDNGATRVFFRNAFNIFYSHQCLVFEADQVEGQQYMCAGEDECVVVEGTVPPPGTPSDDYQHMLDQEKKQNEPTGN